MSNNDLASLQDALNSGYKRWGNYMYEYNRIMEERMTPEERRVLENEKRKMSNNIRNRIRNAENAELENAKAKNVALKKKKHFNVKTKTLKRIAKLCKWECKGEKCWAHDEKMCPYIHKGEAGYNEKHSVKKGGKRRATRKRAC